MYAIQKCYHPRTCHSKIAFMMAGKSAKDGAAMYINMTLLQRSEHLFFKLRGLDNRKLSYGSFLAFINVVPHKLKQS